MKIILLLLAVLILAAGCVQQNQQETIKIGVIQPLTGSLSSLGESLRDAAILAVEDINSRDGVNGKNLELIIEDSQSDPKLAVEAYNKLRNVDNVRIVMTSTSGHVLAIKPLTENDKVLLLSFAAHPDITKDSQFVFRHSNVADDDAKTIADAILLKNYTSVGIIHINDDWGIATEKILRQLLEDKGVVVTSEKHEQRDTDFRTQLTKLSEADAIVDVSAGTSAGLIIKQVRELGYTGDFYSGVGFSLTPDAANTAGDAAKGIYYQEYPVDLVFVSRFKDRFGKDPANFGQAVYTGTEIVANALSKTGSEDPQVLSSYIKNMKQFTGTYETVQIKENGEIPLKTFVRIYGV